MPANRMGGGQIGRSVDRLARIVVWPMELIDSDLPIGAKSPWYLHETGAPIGGSHARRKSSA
jgi:hypothetical protein